MVLMQKTKINDAIPIRASDYLTLPSDLAKKMVKIGLVPINDAFYKYFGNKEPLILFYGSYGNGKSKFVAQDLIEKCRVEPYFKCFYGRKIYDRVRISLFDEFCTEIEERGLQKEFTYSRADNSSMVITHYNGNRLIPFGGDKPDTLKSIKDPTHIVCEEFDQFNEKDFGFLFSRLRTQKSYTQFIAMFNSEPIKNTHWIKSMFFDESQKTGTKALKVFGTYKENYFINHEEYEEKLRAIANGREHIYQSIANGMFGITLNNNPFFYALDRKKHYTLNPFELNLDYYVDLSFDFNKIPSTLVCGQMQVDGFHVFDLLMADLNTYVGKSALEAVCYSFVKKYPQILPSRLRITGDASGKAGSADRKVNQNYYTDISKNLRVSMSQIDPYIRGANLPHQVSGDMINAFFADVPIFFHEGAEQLFEEMEKAECDTDGTLNEWKKKSGGHAVDSVRYLITDLWIRGTVKDWRGKLMYLKNRIWKTQ